ncbi:hypothetical protein Taro_042850 [Colocasia esculenta]|uniref:Uncharacterized protein n=1 Tax=Colocasia esculenta TaxID=4460 RepID=A0A843WZE8_COLES|nr:hypothetical protein [Colocasia esculenta]
MVHIYCKTMVAYTPVAIWRERNDSLFRGERGAFKGKANLIIIAAESYLRANWDKLGGVGVLNTDQMDWCRNKGFDVECILEIAKDKHGRVEEFLAAGEAGDPHTKPFFFPVVSAATCTDNHLEVDQSVDTLSQISPEGVLGRSLVSTLPDLVSTLPDQFCPKGVLEGL